MKKIITLLCILISINCLSQNEDYQLKVKVSGNMPSIEYIIDIHRSSKNVKVYYSRYTGENKFDEIDKLRYNQLRHKKDRTTAETKEIMNLIENFKIFSKECFMYSANDPIIKLSDSIIRSKEMILSEIENNKNRVVLDAIQVKVTINDKKGSKYSYSIHAPDNYHYRLFTQFLNESDDEFKIK